MQQLMLRQVLNVLNLLEYATATRVKLEKYIFIYYTYDDKPRN